MAAAEHALKIAHIAAQAAFDKKAENIVLLDVSEHLVITDLFLICSASNERQVKAIVEGIEEELLKSGVKAIRREGHREGRWVLPVRTDAHERFPGIVHATSGSGSTLFVEPRAVIPLGNRLKVLEGEVRREEELVYERLTEKPDILYGGGLKSNYQKQGIALSKHFKR